MQADAFESLTLPSGVHVLACASSDSDANGGGLYVGTSHGSIYCVPYDQIDTIFDKGI